MIDDERIRVFLEIMIQSIEDMRDALMIILEHYHVKTEELRMTVLRKETEDDKYG